jgi:deoxyadenosine/deoxycytidine kinase
MGLNGTKLQAFSTVYDEVKRDIGHPQLLVHLRCDAHSELQRIRKRAREIEASITIGFLENLNNVIEREVTAAQDLMDVISIDSAALDFADDEATKKRIVELIYQGLRLCPCQCPLETGATPMHTPVTQDFHRPRGRKGDR